MTPKDKMISEIRERCDRIFRNAAASADESGYASLIGGFTQLAELIDLAEAGDADALASAKKIVLDAAQSDPLSVCRPILLLQGDYLISRAQKLPAGDRSLFPRNPTDDKNDRSEQVGPG